MSIVDDILKTSGAADLAELPTKLGIQDMSIDSIEVDKNWWRSGAETYACQVTLISFDARVKLFVKACVAPAYGSELSSIVDEWVNRRKLIEESGVRTPKLYFVGGGLIIEEFIPFQLAELKFERNSDRALYVSSTLQNILTTIRQLGFSPVRLFTDLMFDGHQPVIVDFGQDLGPSGVFPSSDSLSHELAKMEDILFV